MEAILNFIDEKELLVQLNSGDAAAFHALYDRYKRPLAAKLFQLLKSTELVEDTLQDVFLSLWEYRGKFDVDRPFAPLLYRMARNKVTDIYRKAYRDMNYRAQLTYDDEQLEDPVDVQMINQEDMELLQKALDTLPERQREVFVLHKIEGRSYKEISELLSISHAAINQHIYRASKTLQITMNQQTLLLLACLAGEGFLYL